MKSFQLDLGDGLRLTKTGLALLVGTATFMILIAVPLMRQVGHWTHLFLGLFVFANGALTFFAGGWFAKRLGFPVTTEDRQTRESQFWGARYRALAANNETDWHLRQAIELCDEILDSCSELADALGLPSIQIVKHQGDYYLRCRNIDEFHYPESVRQTITYEKDDWKSAHLGPFKNEAEAARVERQILGSLNGDAH